MTAAEEHRRLEVLAEVLDSIRQDRQIKLPRFDPKSSLSAPETALQSVGIEPNAFGGTAGEYRYQFEGEEDLLHLIITRCDAGALTPEQAQNVAAWLLPGVPPALIWLKPGKFTQHFYLGHDDLSANIHL